MMVIAPISVVNFLHDNFYIKQIVLLDHLKNKFSFLLSGSDDNLLAYSLNFFFLWRKICESDDEPNN